MNEQARKVILEHFCKQRGIAIGSMSQGLADMVCAVTAPYLLMIECLDQLDHTDPSCGLVVKLIDRAYGTAAGSLALVSLGHLREAEILSRSVFESAVTITYIVQKNPSLRLGQFFNSYVEQERRQNRKWEEEVRNVPTDIQRDHQARIDQKNEALDHYQQFIAGYLRHCGVAPDKAPKWPGLIERLAEMGRRIEYRTVYAAMCSQSHHDAEDILNHFIANSVEGFDEFADRMEREADTFSLLMVLLGFRWFVEAALSACKWLQFPTVVAEAKQSMDRVERELQLIAAHIDTGQFPESWKVT